MSTHGKKRIAIVAGVCAASAFGLLLTQDSTRAQEETSGIAVGTYEPGQVAQQTGLQQKMTEQMSGLQQRMQQAQQDGDQEAMQAIQGEAQQIQQKAVEDFESSIDEAMPKIAESAGVQIIAVEVSYAADGIETKDVTAAIIEELGGAAPQPQISLPPTQQQQ